MPIPPLPPLRVREADGSPNAIPVIEIVVSNGTLTNLGGGRVALATGGASGAGGGDPGQVTVGSAFFESVAGGIMFATTSQLIGQEAPLLFWDEAQNRLGVGTSAPGMVLDVVGSARVSGQLVLTLDAASAGHAVRAARTISTTAPVAGGGDLTANRTLTVDTLCLITSGRAINTTEPVRGGGNLSADRTITIATASATSAGAVTSADWITFNAKQSTITWPLITGSGGTGLNFVGSGGMILGVSTGGTALEYKVLAAGNNITITHAGSTMTFAAETGGGAGPTYAATGNQYVVLAAAADLAAERVLTAGTGLTLTDGGANSAITVARSAQVVEVELRPIMANTGNANVVWSSVPRTSYYDAAWAFSDGTVGTMTWAGWVPARLWGSPLWNLILESEAAAGVGGNVMLSLRARDYANADSLTLGLTLLVQSATYAILSSPILSIQAATASNFDAAEAISGGCRLVVETIRHGDAANDTLGAAWNLLGVKLRVLTP